MKQKLFAFMLSLSAMAMAVFTSCDKDEPEQFKPASVEIKIESTSSTGISFTLTPSDAEQAFYKCVKSSEPESGTYTETNGKEASTIQIDNLEENTEYTISAYAVNAAGENSETVSETAVTTSLASVKIKVTSVTDSSITFTLTPVNAVNCHYAVTDPAQAETAELTNETGSGEEGEYTINGLDAGKRYTIAATATNATGETSERSFASSTTELTPAITIENITADDNSAIIKFGKIENCKESYYYISKTGNTPENKDLFSKIESNPVYLYELEKECKYSIWTYGVNNNGYEGKISETGFATTSIQEKDYNVVISEITQFDATIDITWNTEKYKGAYWIAGIPEQIGTPETFDWQSNIDSYKARQVYYQGKSNLSAFQPQPGELHRMGVIFTDLEGKIDPSTAIWRDIKLSEIEFGAVDCKVEIEKIALSFSTITYKINNNGASGYYFGITPKSNISDINSYAKTVIKGQLKTDMDTELQYKYLDYNMEYVLVAIPVNQNGSYGEIASIEFTSEKPIEKNNSEFEAEFSKAAVTDMDFNVVFGNNTVEIRYIVFQDSYSGYDTDEKIMEKLARSQLSIKESGILKAKGLKSDNEYHIWMASINKYDEIGKVIKFTQKTDKINFDGTGNVSVNITDFKKDQYGRFVCKFTLTPDNNTDRYYYRVTDKWIVDDFSNEKFVEDFMMDFGYDPCTGITEEAGNDGNGVYLSQDAYIVILPIDKEGKFCPLIKYFVEETSSN